MTRVLTMLVAVGAVAMAACSQTRRGPEPAGPTDGRRDERPTASAVESGEPSPRPRALDTDPLAVAPGALDGAPDGESGDQDAALRGDGILAADGGLWDDPMALHREGTDDLLSLLWWPASQTSEQQKARQPFLRANFGGGPGRFNQGNKAIAHHDIGRARCLAGLRDVTLQTEEQRARCGGAENMVPIWTGGKPEGARFCIDIFEFPNKACELPMVWTAPSATATVCAMQGKRLCTQAEWQTACRTDPEGGKDSVYAYGNELDLTVCNTNKPHPMNAFGSWICNARDAKTTYDTCNTETEPSGAFPKCRSRFGVFDQHGNVAEVMTRKEADGSNVSQLKGSAFFYVDVARRHDQAQPKDAPRETYPDHCNYDPRWHVEPMDRALHVNYHLGFRCCKSIN